ncbi:hypothetical protein DU43_18335 [Methanosarcina mazei]|uniref:Uncharacterized protein n=1 Tax=Methanosarcina mazei TaxID=2209 RepID=A0A0F8GWV9_METMZ|nr:hypothetical protein DU43_18335 [Methanosarcina mazei]
MKGLIPFYLIYCYGKTSLYTVFIKAVDSDLLINEDNIEEYGTLEMKSLHSLDLKINTQFIGVKPSKSKRTS